MAGSGDTPVPWIERETSWKVIVLGLAGIYGIGLFVGFMALIIPGHEDFAEATEVFWRLALIGGAVVTFATVMWRGMIATRQADQQQRQVNQAEANNLASLLQKGAELLSEADKPAHVSTGVTTLKAVATDPNPRFSQQAVDLIAGHIERLSPEGHGSQAATEAIDAIHAIARETGRIESAAIRCDALPQLAADAESPRWPNPADSSRPVFRPIWATKMVTYKGGRMAPVAWSDFDARVVSDARLQDMLISDFEELSVLRADTIGCTFWGCQFKQIYVSVLMTNRFVRCDFSGTEILGGPLTGTRFSGVKNYHWRGQPPLLINTGDKQTVKLTNWPFAPPR